MIHSETVSYPGKTIFRPHPEKHPILRQCGVAALLTPFFACVSWQIAQFLQGWLGCWNDAGTLTLCILSCITLGFLLLLLSKTDFDFLSKLLDGLSDDDPLQDGN